MDHKISNSLRIPVKLRVVKSFCYPELLIQDPMKIPLILVQGVVIPDLTLFRPLTPDPIYLVTTLS